MPFVVLAEPGTPVSSAPSAASSPVVGVARRMHREGLMIVQSDVAEFVVLHRAHGRLVGELRTPAAGAPRFIVACPCGVIFERRLTGDEALDDLLGALARAQRPRADGPRAA